MFSSEKKTQKTKKKTNKRKLFLKYYYAYYLYDLSTTKYLVMYIFRPISVLSVLSSFGVIDVTVNKSQKNGWKKL